MSQITCGVVRDLLPLYVDGCCGADSRRLVEEHLAGCPDCRRARADMAGELPPAEGAPVPEAEPARAMKTGLKKLRRRWALSLLAVLLIPLLGWLTWNQVHGTGPCFTNFHERMLADSFVRTLAAGDYEGAFHRLELDELYQDFSGDSRLDRADLSDFESRAQAFFLDSARALEEAGGITSWRYLSIQRTGSGYTVQYAVTTGGQDYSLSVDASDSGVRHFSGGSGYIPEPDPLRALSLWSESLWQDYAGCYLDPETGRYVWEEE